MSGLRRMTYVFDTIRVENEAVRNFMRGSGVTYCFMSDYSITLPVSTLRKKMPCNACKIALRQGYLE